ncbi:hypothetical protein BCAR13_410113 [Paraburkholderia caribensis]|nr:hypothetical protein BCAR13_410113 [Paraburkholderia caribensis]
MGLLTFLPFLLKAKGVSPQLTGTALALAYNGGAAGKFVCTRSAWSSGAPASRFTAKCDRTTPHASSRTDLWHPPGVCRRAPLP